MGKVLRSEKVEGAYQKHRKNLQAGVCPLCESPAIKTFTHWKIMENIFPYDYIAQKHDMLVPLRHVTEKELTPEEKEEFSEIKNGYLQSQEYDYFIEPVQDNKSIADHFHLHLIVGKETE